MVEVLGASIYKPVSCYNLPNFFIDFYSCVYYTLDECDIILS
jgi:hypothetical protein